MPVGVRGLQLCLGVLTLFLSSSPAVAAAVNAASCSQVHVQAAVNAALSGDTVAVPAGSCIWTTGVTVSGKNITLQGAGKASTVITSKANGIQLVNLTTTASRLTGFGFVIPANDNGFVFAQGTGVRIDRNRFNSTDGLLRNVYFSGNSRNGLAHPGGLIDNNEFINTRVLVQGDIAGTPTGTSVWTEASTIGAADQSRVLYIEDNTFDGSTQVGIAEALDANYSGRAVFRFNTTIATTVSVHSLSGGNQRGSRSWEVYHNTMDVTGYSYMTFLRAGTGMVFNNTVSTAAVNTVVFDNERSFVNPFPAPAGMCDGKSTWDGNTGGRNGWPCRDQIGRGVDGVGTFPQPQASEPAYVWDNTVADVQTNPYIGNCGSAVKTNGSCADIVANRDFYQKSASFNGTSGVGSGTLANRPATCTTGVGYWATDQGEWNSKQAGRDGQLYRCSATNTWSLYYVPYSYPHPLQQGGGPAAPTSLQVTQ